MITQTCFDKTIKIYSYEHVKIKDKNFKETEPPYFQKKKLEEDDDITDLSEIDAEMENKIW